jgi:phosphate:Na+ symporter
MFKVLSTALLLPLSEKLEKLVTWLVPDARENVEEAVPELDDRLLATPSLALARCREKTEELAREAGKALESSLAILIGCSRQTDRTSFAKEADALSKTVCDSEERTDLLEDTIDSYLIRLSARDISDEDNEWITTLLKISGDYERIADHSINLLDAADRMRSGNLAYTEEAQHELDRITDAVLEVMALSMQAFRDKDMDAAGRVEPLEQVVDQLKEELRNTL